MNLEKSKEDSFEIAVQPSILAFLAYRVLIAIVIGSVILMLVKSVLGTFNFDLAVVKRGIGIIIIFVLPILFSKDKIRIDGDKITAIRVCRLRRTFTIDKIKEILITKYDEPGTKLCSEIDVCIGLRTYTICNHYENFERFYNYIMENVAPGKIKVDDLNETEESVEENIIEDGKKDCFDVGSAHLAVFFIIAVFVIFSGIILLHLVFNSFKPDWNDYKMAFWIWVAISFPILFVKAKVKVNGDKMTVIKTCGLRRTFTLDKITKVFISEPDKPTKTNVVARVTVCFGKREFSVDSSLANYKKFYNYILENVEQDKIDLNVWHVEQISEEEIDDE
ncbi:MAG: hypothetical protein E7510_00535 [Ruminococcus sp.]|nr:hypothetical protein [Ruminococcus sp.]